MALWMWSKTAASNATADPSINWAAGMAASSVDPSGRAMMAAIKAALDDISGSLVTGGTNAAYTIASNQDLGSGVPIDGQCIAAQFHTSCAANATLKVDAGAAYPIAMIGYSPPTYITTAKIVSAGVYMLRFNVAASAWLMFGTG